MLRRTILLLPFLLPFPASGEPVRDAYVAAELISQETAVQPGRSFTVGLRLIHDPGWHSYWKSSTTGYANSIHWDLPEGFSAGELQWPVPQTYEMAGLVEFVYEDEIVMPVELTAPADLEPGTSVTLRARAEWLMCEEVCIPGEVDLELTLPVVDTEPEVDARWSEAFARAFDHLPREELAHEATAWREGNDVFLLVETEGSDIPGELYFFDSQRYLSPTLTQTQTRLGERMTLLQFQVDPAGAGEAERLEGVLATLEGSWVAGADHPGWWISLPWSERPASLDLPAGASASLRGLPSLIALAFAGGLILNLMPCVFPVIGLKIMGFVNQAGAERKKVILHGLSFTAGVLLSFWILAALLLVLRSGGDELGWGFQLQNPVFVFALTLVLFVFALNMSGVFEIGGSAVGVGSGLTARSGLSGSFFSGILATVVATPCAAPFLAPALGAALALPPVSSLVVFTGIALGLATPYLLLSAFPQLVKRLPRPGPWMETFKQGLAFLLYASAGVLLWVLVGQLVENQGYTPFALLNVILSLVLVAVAAWVYGRWGAPQRKTGVRRAGYGAAVLLALLALGFGYPRAVVDVDWEPWAPGKAEALTAEGKLVYVDFTARWCVTCQTNKATVFQSDEVKRFFQDNEVVALKADWTNRDPEIAAALRQFGRAAVPFNLVFGPSLDEPHILPEILTPGIVLDALEAARLP